ncbi:MAG: acyl carrier protein [Reyranella sp.]|nr:acyl carrier protein [Reyranella sp.]
MDARSLIAEITRTDLSAQSDATPLMDLENWDSLRTVKLVLRLEQITGRTLDEVDIEGLKTVGDVARLLEVAA